MTKPYVKHACFLTYLGAVPFGLGMMMLVFGFHPEEASTLVRAYGAIIVSFICGIHWGIGLQNHNGQKNWLLVSSNGIALIAWGALLLDATKSGLMILTLCLLILLLVDERIYRLHQTHVWFIQMRRRVTGLVILCLVISMVVMS